MNRREFIGALGASVSSFFILPGAGRVWRARRKLSPFEEALWKLQRDIENGVCGIRIPINRLSPAEIEALYGISVRDIAVPGMGTVRITRHSSSEILRAEPEALREFMLDYKKVGGRIS